MKSVELAPCWAIPVTLERALDMEIDAAFVHDAEFARIALNASKAGAPARRALGAARNARLVDRSMPTVEIFLGNATRDTTSIIEATVLDSDLFALSKLAPCFRQ